MAYTAYYRLNGDCNDAMGAYHLINTGTATFVQGKFNDCVSLNGSSQYLSIADNLGVGTSAFTMSCWVNLAAYAGAGLASVFLQLNDETGDTECWIELVTAAGPVYQIASVRRRMSGTYEYQLVTLPWSLNTWYNAVLVYDSSRIKSYVNGKLYGDAASSGNGSSSSPNKFIIGEYWTGGAPAAGYYTNGKIDEVIVEARAWTAAEIKNYYNFSMGLYAPKMRW